MLAKAQAAPADDGCIPICPALLRPVCADNGTCLKQFDNDCLLKYANCKVKADGGDGEYFLIFIYIFFINFFLF